MYKIVVCPQSGCQSAKFHSTTVTRLSPHWFAFGTDPIGWQVPRCEDRGQVSTQCRDMTHAPWQGVLVYSRPVGWAELGAGQQEGVYIYPDWAACVRGVWANHTLVQGRS